MTFFDTFSEKFAAYKRENKRKKDFKNLKSEEKLKQFLKKDGSDLKKELKKAVDNGEKVNFSNLPGSAKSFFGQNFVAERKRENKWNNATLIRLTGQSFKFNQGNKVKDFLAGQISQSEGPAFVVNYIKDDEESRRKAARQVIKNKGEKLQETKKNKKPLDTQLFELFKRLSSTEDSDAYWEAWGLFADDDEFRIFINIVNE
jgi:hypothetical protein